MRIKMYILQTPPPSAGTLREVPDDATNFMAREDAVAAAMSLDMPRSIWPVICANMSSSINRKHITYRNSAGGGPSHGHR